MKNGIGIAVVAALALSVQGFILMLLYNYAGTQMIIR